MNAADTLKAKNASEENAARLLTDMLLDFTARYAPNHPRERDYFNAAMTTIVRQVTVDAHRVYGDQVSKIMSAVYNSAPLHIVSPDKLGLSDLKPGGIVYAPGTTIKALNWAESAWETGHGVERKAVEWRADLLGLTYTVVEHAKTFVVALDGRRFTNRATLELAKAVAYDDCAVRVKSVLT